MAHKKSQSVGEDLVDLAALLPWWAGCILAFVSYIGLHPLAIQAVGPVSPQNVVATVVWKGLATAAQYLLPVLFLLGAVISAARKFQRRQLVSNVSASTSASVLEGMTWQEFELLVGEHFRHQGFRVLDVGGGGADGGVDLVLLKGSETHVVQCKQWKAYKVGVQVVRELYGVMAAKGAAGGYVVTSGTFTQDAIDFASGRNITLLDGAALFGLLKRAKQSTYQRMATPPSTRPKPEQSTVSNASHGASSNPVCPQCDKPMVIRTARKGKEPGAMFWGCINYPTCRHTEHL